MPGTGVGDFKFAEPLISEKSVVELTTAVEEQLDVLGKAKSGELGAKRLEALMSLSVLYVERNELELADKRLRKALKLAQLMHGEKSIEFRALMNLLGVLYFRKDDPRRALDTFKELIKALRGHQRGDARENAKLLRITTRNFAGVLCSQGKHSEASDFLAQFNDPGVVPAGADGTNGKTERSTSFQSNNSAGSGNRKSHDSLRKRLSLLIGSVESEAKQLDGERYDFVMDLPLGGNATDPNLLAPMDSIIMRMPMVQLLDQIAMVLGDARRNDHIELMFRTALAGSYGTLTRLDEQRIGLRLAVLLGNIPEFLQEATLVLQRSLSICEELFGSDDIQVAVIAGDLGTFFARKGDLDTAEALFLRSLRILRSLEVPHLKEDTVYTNLSMLLKVKGNARTADSLAQMELAIDDAWILSQSETDLSDEAFGLSMKAALYLEETERDTPAWYNWRENERKKALLAYLLEVFRDNSRNWEPEIAPKYLAIVLATRQLLGRAEAMIKLNFQSLPPPRIKTPQERSRSRSKQADSRAGHMSEVLSLDGESVSKSKPMRDTLEAPRPERVRRTSVVDKIFRRGSSKSKNARTLNSDIDLRDLLSNFFQEFSPSKDDPEFINKAINRFKKNPMRLLETLERKYNVTFSSDGSWTKPDNGAASLTSSSSAQLVDRDTSGTISPDLSLREVLVNFYKEFAPDREDAVDTMLVHFEGRHQALFAALGAKYKVNFQRNGKALPR